MPTWRRSWKVLLALVSVAIFVVALKLMQTGAQAFAPFIEEHFEVETPLGALGFGWGASYVLLGGSPMAATAVTFFDAREIDETAALAMITGSRMGAAFIALLLGFFYVFYHQEPMRDLRIGLLALLVTASVYVPAFALGYGALESGLFSSLDEGTSSLGEALEGKAVEQVKEKAEQFFPPWGIFLAGLILIMGSFKLFDLSLPSVDAENGKMSGIRRYLYRRWPMFALGAVLTLVSMSVAISLGLLVLLHEQRIVHVRHVVPYIMGANITPFVDTLLAAMAMKRSGATVIVLVEIGAVTIISLLILVFIYRRYEQAMLAAVNWVTARRRNLAIFVAILVMLPVTLLLLPQITTLAKIGGPLMITS